MKKLNYYIKKLKNIKMLIIIIILRKFPTKRKIKIITI